MSIVILALPLCLGLVDVNLGFSAGTQTAIWHWRLRKGVYIKSENPKWILHQRSDTRYLKAKMIFQRLQGPRP